MSYYAKQLGMEMLKAALIAVMGVLLKELASTLHQRIEVEPEDWR